MTPAEQDVVAVANFSKSLRRLMKQAGVTAYRLAQLSGVTDQNISLLRRGKGQPTFSTAVALAEALAGLLGRTPGDVLDEFAFGTSPPPDGGDKEGD